MANHNDFGKEAEILAKEYLIKEGYQILAINYRYQKAEIDIIAEDNSFLIIVEVKARHSTQFILPQEAVTKSKIRNLLLATNHYMEEHSCHKEVRFDIISILPDSSKKLQITHLKNAFESIDGN